MKGNHGNSSDITCQSCLMHVFLGSGGGNVSGDLLRKVLSKRLVITGTTLRSRSLEVPPTSDKTIF